MVHQEVTLLIQAADVAVVICLALVVMGPMLHRQEEMGEVAQQTAVTVIVAPLVIQTEWVVVAEVGQILFV
jgi:hypothetical protein